MLRSFKVLRGFAVRATDGRFGTVSDVYFDDSTWRVRYCVVDSGRWLADRYVLIGSRSLSILDFARRELWVRLSKMEIGRSRSANSDKPVSKQKTSVLTSIRSLARSTDRLDSRPLDRHLRSCSAIIGHRLHALDGKVGPVDDFLIDDKGWIVRELIVETEQPHVPEAARVLVGARKIREINWPNSVVSVDLTRDAILAAPIYTPISGEITVPVIPP